MQAIEKYVREQEDRVQEEARFAVSSRILAKWITILSALYGTYFPEKSVADMSKLISNSLPPDRAAGIFLHDVIMSFFRRVGL